MTRSSLRSVLLWGFPAAALAVGGFYAWRGSGENFFMPHAHCYLFNGQLMLLHGVSDLLIGLSYVAISGTLTYLVLRSRRELPFHWMMLAFALFIVACGATHFMEIWTLQAERPPYWFSGWVKFLTAVASVATAVLLPPLVPKIREVLQSARFAVTRKEELEKGYAELSELYQKAVPAAQRPAAELNASHHETGDGADGEVGPGEGRHDLAQIAREVTEHTRELERAKQAAETANRAKDQFLAVLSHELRTPLTPALAAASNLESAIDIEPEELRASLALIRRNIELEARLVDDLLDITRISKGKLEVHLSSVDLHETIRHAAEMCESAARHKRTEVTLKLEAGEHQIRGDVARLAQVFWNLILNAVKFSPDSGRIHVLTSNPAPGQVRVEVTDEGIGLEPGMLSRVFEPFQQGESSITRRYGGMGLGLSIAKGLMEAHGGSITAHSDGPDRGTTFRVDLATTAAPMADVRSTPEAVPIIPRSLRILLVEDHEDTRSALIRLLKRWGHVVEPVGSVAQAMAAAEAFAPDLLLSDLGLPDGTGIDVMEGLSTDRKRMLAIAMSGFGMDSDLEKTREAGFKAHLVKPVSAGRLKETIDRVASEASLV